MQKGDDTPRQHLSVIGHVGESVIVIGFAVLGVILVLWALMGWG